LVAEETESQHFPTRRVKAPRVPQEALEAVPLATIHALLAACKGERLTDLRDKAVFMTLLDTGARAAELLAMDFADLDLNGAILIRQGKGRKPREKG
jgi:site-specific recombinase XerD